MPFNTQPPYNITVVSILTLNRALNTTYYNGTGKTMWVSVTTEHMVNGIDSVAQAYATVDEIHTLSSVVFTPTVAMDLNFQLSMTFAVMPGHQYNVKTVVRNGGSILLAKWVEAY